MTHKSIKEQNESFAIKKAKDLSEGDYFMQIGQKKWRKVKLIKILGSSVPAEFQGKLLFVLENCKTIVFDKETELKFANYPEKICTQI
jgi:hypothetical protein